MATLAGRRLPADIAGTDDSLRVRLLAWPREPAMETWMRSVGTHDQLQRSTEVGSDPRAFGLQQIMRHKTLAAAGFGLVSEAGALTIGTLIGLGMFAELFVTPSITARDALMGEIAEASGMSLERLAGVRQVLFSIAYVVGPALGFAPILAAAIT